MTDVGIFVTNTDAMSSEDLQQLYTRLKPDIIRRLSEFSDIWLHASDEQLFLELAFCLLTPQSRARTCWAAIENLNCKGILQTNDPDMVLQELKGVRFKYKKSKYVCYAREMFFGEGKRSLREQLSTMNSSIERREWLVKNITGIGYKEASHYLRNIGLGEDLAILDRHILKNLVRYGVIKSVPASMQAKAYLEIEEKMKAFSDTIGIPMAHLDFVLWYKEANEIFK